MKVLYLGLNIRYINNTRNLIPSLLGIHNDLFLYGPGYSSSNTLDNGLQSYCDLYGPFDLICSNEVLSIEFVESEFSDFIDRFSSSHYFNFDINERHLLDMSDFFRNVSNINKILFLITFDSYFFNKEKERIILGLNAYIVGTGKTCAKRKEDCKNVNKEAFYSKVNNNWHNFVQRYSKVIQLPHFIDSSEFFWGDISNRVYDCSVPGTGYWSRLKAIRNLIDGGIKIPKLRYRTIFGILSRLGFKPYSNRIMLYLYNRLFFDVIEDSFSSYTCGSGTEQPMRKFFEIPSKGAILLCIPFNGYEDMGFKDNYNCVVCDPSNVSDKVKYLRKNMEIAISIAENGRKLIFDCHSIHARSDQLQKAFIAIVENKFSRTYWHDGKFYVDTIE
mgnify:CR=1 FL=1|jgi:hypothetical protein